LAPACGAHELQRWRVAGGSAILARMSMTPLAAAVTTRFGIGGLKAALDLAGFHGGSVRAPLRAPDEAARTEIKAALDRITGLT